jgi:ABC-type phosphate transport system substrate-binding protein
MISKMFDLSGRVALVSGAASGMARAMALTFAEAGADLVLADLNADGLIDARTGYTAAAEGAMATLAANTDYRVSIVNAKSPAAYPIASFTWLLVSAQQSDATKGKKLADFLRWALSDGQKDAAGLDYAPLPTNVVTLLDKRLTTVKNVAAK